MTYFIGGEFDGQSLAQDEIDKNETSIVKLYGPRTGMERSKASYIKTQVSKNGEVKTFYVFNGDNPKGFILTIERLWNDVKTDIYVI